MNKSSVLCLTFLLLCFQFTWASETKPKKETAKTISGSYLSIKGVMNAFSCVCYNGGFITTTDGNRYPVCFDSLTEEGINCLEIIVRGTEKTQEVVPSKGGNCSKYSWDFIEVSSFECKD